MAVTVLNPVVVVVQGRCTSVKRVFKTFSKRFQSVFLVLATVTSWFRSQVRNAVVKWSTGCVCHLRTLPQVASSSPVSVQNSLLGGSRGGREWVVASSSPGEGASRGDLALGGDECNGAEPCRGSSTASSAF